MSNYQFNVSFLDVVFAFDILMNISNFDKIRLTWDINVCKIVE